MSEFIESLDYRDIPTPWEPQPIVSRYSFFRTDRQSIEAAVAVPTQTHLVREVRVRTHMSQFGYNYLYNDLSIDQTLEGLALVDDQFRQLENLTEIHVAPTDWHVFSDGNNMTRTLARVQIIDGVMPPKQYRSSGRASEPTPENLLLQQTLENGIRRYQAKHQGPELDDIRNFNQYIFGNPRTELGDQMAQKTIYLVDIEPLLTLDRRGPSLRSLPDHARGERIA